MNNQFPRAAKSNSAFKIVMIFCLVLLGIWIMGMLGIYFLCNKMMKSSEAYERTFTDFTGVFEGDDSVVAPLSGEKTLFAFFNVRRTHSKIGPGRDDPSDDFEFLYFKPGTFFNVNGKKYHLSGTQVHRFHGKKKYTSSTELSIVAVNSRGKHHDEIPPAINGLDVKLDKYLREIKDYSFQGNGCVLSLREWIYSGKDTVQIRVHVRNDTIFLRESMR